MERLTEVRAYEALGLGDSAQRRLATLADLLLSSPTNVVGTRTLADLERHHFLDSLSLLQLGELGRPGVTVVDVGSGGGLPALVLAIALPEAHVTAVESIRKKCDFIARAAEQLGLSNVSVLCERAELFGRRAGRDRFDVAVVRAVGPLPTVAELSAPLVTVGGLFVAMKGRIDETEWATGVAALGILGVEHVRRLPVIPFPGARHRQLVLGEKVRPTPAGLPRNGPALAKRPLGSHGGHAAPWRARDVSGGENA